MNMATQDTETAILGAVRDYIGSYSKRLGELGLAYEILIDRSSSKEGGYRSEARAEFSDENGVWDILEFEVVRGGNLLVSLEDVKNWLPGAFGSVVSRREIEVGDGGERVIH
jgi:hypothetical protein